MAKIPNSETGFAKVNLALHVRRRRADGYHDIDTLFAFVDRGDSLSADVRNDGILRLEIDGPFAAELATGPDNLVLRAAEALRAGDVARGADIRLTKVLPVASGIGGGSADAAATLRLLSRLWGIAGDERRMLAIGAKLGADVPACMMSRTSIGSGTGADVMASDGSVSGLHILLANPLLPVRTAEVFVGWDGRDRGPLPRGDALAMAEGGRNDLQAPAIALCPAIVPLLDAIAASGACIARMSGSGATCFGLYASAEAVAAAEAFVRARLAPLWTMTGRLR